MFNLKGNGLDGILARCDGRVGRRSLWAGVLGNCQP